MNELIERARVKAGVMEMGERIAWGSDTALIRELADALEQQAKQIADLQRELDNERAREIHSCSPDCTRDGCVNRVLRAQIEELAAALTMKDEALKSSDDLLRALPSSGGIYGLAVMEANEKALALQPHASLVAKIKADAVRKLGIFFSSEGLNFSTFRQVALDYADRIEKGEAR